MGKKYILIEIETDMWIKFRKWRRGLKYTKKVELVKTSFPLKSIGQRLHEELYG